MRGVNKVIIVGNLGSDPEVSCTTAVITAIAKGLISNVKINY